MAKKKETQQEPESVLVAAAKSIGTAAGTIAAAVGITPSPQKVKVPKLADREKRRLPRRQKKAAKKAAIKAKT
jgi:hypothetical protein